MASSARDKTYFEQQREILLGDIALSFEQVLSNINKLNRSLEAVITVGNEFSSVETLWSQFENVMATDEEDGAKYTKQPQEQDNGEEGRISREENDHERAKK